MIKQYGSDGVVSLKENLKAPHTHVHGALLAMSQGNLTPRRVCVARGVQWRGGGYSTGAQGRACVGVCVQARMGEDGTYSLVVEYESYKCDFGWGCEA